MNGVVDFVPFQITGEGDPEGEPMDPDPMKTATFGCVPAADAQSVPWAEFLTMIGALAVLFGRRRRSRTP